MMHTNCWYYFVLYQFWICWYFVFETYSISYCHFGMCDGWRDGYACTNI